MNLSGLDLNLLRVLDALLHEGSTVRAAQRVGLSQPAVSAALGRLRHALKDPLFVRHGQQLRPTEYAQSIALPLRKALDDLQLLLAGPMPFDPARAEASFKICASDFFAVMLMPELADRLAGTAPNVRAQLVDLVPENYVATLERYEVDLALIPRAEFPEWCDVRPVFQSGFVMIARRGNPHLAAAGISPGQGVPLDLFCELGHVLFSPEGRISAMSDAALAKLGRRRRVVMTLPVFAGVCRAVAASDRVALIPEQLAEKLGPEMDIEAYTPPMPITPSTICMVWHRRNTNDPAHTWFRTEVARILEPLDTGQGRNDLA